MMRYNGNDVWNIVVLSVLIYAALSLAWFLSHAPPRRADRQVALTFPLPGIAAALSDRTGISLQYARLLELEFRRWFVAAACSPVLVGMSSKDVDSFWHELLLHRDLYESYSRAVCGRIVRHVEGVGGERLDARCWAAYEAVWGVPPPESI